MSLPSSTATSISISGLPSGDVECMALCPSGSTPCKPDSTVGRLVCMMEDVNSMALCSLNPSPCNPSQDCLTQSSVRTRMEIDYMQINKDSMALDTDFSLVQSTDLPGSFLEVISTRSNPLSKQNHSLIVTFFYLFHLVDRISLRFWHVSAPNPSHCLEQRARPQATHP
jgi:hypothetical protein